MIPVRLKLTNFLSYGEGAPALDFEQFHVACLSGKNGQGKSALLDAITWVLWGEARKSQGAIKPDEDLIRVGCTDMRVELVFDLEGERYRVIRGYHRSKSGKTNKSELEVQLFDATADTYRPITQGHLRDTQHVLLNILGLDYETFVNSAFLLQGRSDRFTRKNASERKAILAGILNLGKYDALNTLARDFERKTAQEIAQVERDVERLEGRLAEETKLQTAYETLESDLEEASEAMENLAVREKDLQEQITALRVEAERETDIKRKVEETDQRLKDTRKEALGYREKLEAAAELLARQAEIKADHARRETLQAERDNLDTQQDLHRGIERQIEAAEREFNDWKNQIERKLTELEAQQRIEKQRQEEYALKLEQVPKVKAALKTAREAHKELEELEKKVKRFENLSARKTELEKRIAEARAGLKARHEALQKSMAQKQATLTTMTDLQAKAKALEADYREFENAQAAFESTKQEGMKLSAEHKALQARIERLKDEQKEAEEKKQRIAGAEWKDCPTCGTPLTDSHRKKVLETYTEQHASIHDQVILLRHKAMQQSEQLESLRQKAREQKQAVDQLAEIPGALTRIQADMDRFQKDAQRLEQDQGEIEKLGQQLEKEAYARSEQEALRVMKETLTRLSLDQDQLRTLRQEAAQLERWQEADRELNTIRESLKSLEPTLKKRVHDLDLARKEIDEGNPKLSERIRTQKVQLSQIGYDGEAHQKIKTELAGLAGIGEQLANLLHAEQRKSEWEAAEEKTQERARQYEAELAQLRTTLGGIRDRLMIQGQVQKELDQLLAEKQTIEARIQALQVQKGQLQAKLEQREADRATLKKHQKENKDLIRQRRLYKHLRGAFGKHGIPSLIIEQTLPEIEQRANDLLSQLSDGLTQIRLETLKDKKSGRGTKETLEIRITDEQGVSRPYETFSGGEAFRVNFALRIALSQLLAERSGVRIRTLVIDEGFGTQDEQGVQNLVDAIQKVQDDFDKILVITHLKELKEVFPVRIEVVKHPVEGSRYDLVGI